MLKKKLADRTGVVACFVLLDLDTSEQLTWTELEGFVDSLRPVWIAQYSLNLCAWCMCVCVYVCVCVCVCVCVYVASYQRACLKYCT